MAGEVGVLAQTQALLPILEFRRDFRLAGRDFRAQLEPEPEVAYAQPSWAQPQRPSSETGLPQPVPCRRFLRAGLSPDRRFPSNAAHDLSATLCALACERAQSLGHDLRAPAAAVSVAQDRTGTRDIRPFLRQLSGHDLLQLVAEGQMLLSEGSAPAPRGTRLRALVQLARNERERAQVRIIVGDGDERGVVLGDGAPLTDPYRPDRVAPPSVTVLGFDGGVDPPAGMLLTEVDGRAVYGWTSAALEFVIKRAEADQTPLALTFSAASTWVPMWQDMRTGAAILLQAVARRRAATNSVHRIRLHGRERQQALLEVAITRVQSMHRGRMSRRIVSLSQTRSLVLTLQRLYRFKVRQRELGEWAALKLQTCARRFLARHAYNRKRNAAVAIQSARRALLVRIVFRRQRMAVCRIQSRCRGRRARQQVAGWVSAAVYIERCQRGHVARLVVKTMREELRLLGIAATACQTKLRGSLARRWLRRLRSATVKVQAFVRGQTARQRVAEQHAAATTIQKRQRMVVALRIWRAQRGAVQVWQRFARGWSTRKALAEELRQIKLAKVLWAEMDESDVKKMVTEPTKENLERMIEFNNKFEGQLRALRSAAALNPNSLTSPRGIAIEKPEFDVMFSEPGSLGIRFAPHKRTGDMEVTAVKPGTQAQRHKSLHPGLVLIAVADVDVAGKAPREVFDMLKQGGRPLKLSFLRTIPHMPGKGATIGSLDTLSGLMSGKQKTNVLTAVVNAQAAEELLVGGYTFHPQTSYTRHLLKDGKRGHEAPFHRRRAEGVVREILQMQCGDIVTDREIDLAAKTVLTLPNDKPRLRSIRQLKGQKKLMMAVNAIQARDFEVRNCHANAVQDKDVQFDVTFSEPGSLGIRFAPHKRTGDMEVTAVKPGTQAQRHKNLQPGLVLIAVAGVDVAGKAPREVFDMLKQGGRPLKLSFLCPRLKRSGAESPVDHKSLTEPVRLYEHGAVPSPPSAPTVRIPMTPHKLTKPQIRRQPSPSRHLTAVPQRGLEGASARALRLSPSPDAGETTSSGKDAWNRTTKSNPDESWAKMQAAEAAAAQQLAQQRADAPHRAGLKVSSTIGIRKPQSTASTAANSTAKAKAKTVPEQQLNQHTLSLPGTRLQVAHSHRKRQPPVPPVVRPLHIARASDKETIVNCQGRKRQHKALQGQPDSAGVQAMAQIVAGTQSAVARPQSAERQLSRYAPAQRDNRAGTVHSQKKNRQPPAQLPPRDAREVTAIRHSQPRPRERKALLGPPIPRSTMTGGVEEGVPPVPTEEKLRPRTPPPHGARAPDKDMANVAIVDGYAGVNTMAKIAGATHARWRTANQASDPP